MKGTSGEARFQMPLPGVLVKPFVVYRHQPKRCNSVIGGYVYRGSESPVSAWPIRVWRSLWRRVECQVCGMERLSIEDAEPFNPPDLLSSFGEGIDGELFVLSFDGHVYRLT